MTKQEIEQEIQRLEVLIVLLQMKENWTIEDYKYNYQWSKQVYNLKKELEEIK